MLTALSSTCTCFYLPHLFILCQVMLHIPSLVLECARAVLRDMWLTGLRALGVNAAVALQNDFTPEEEEEVRRESQWAFD
jgi:hypothetical protein